MRGPACGSPATAPSGIACNKLLAKMVSGVHKPDDQTILLPTEAWVRDARVGGDACQHLKMPHCLRMPQTSHPPPPVAHQMCPAAHCRPSWSPSLSARCLVWATNARRSWRSWASPLWQTRGASPFSGWPRGWGTPWVRGVGAGETILAQALSCRTLWVQSTRRRASRGCCLRAPFNWAPPFPAAPGPVLHNLCRGLDPSPVRQSGPPKSITVEDSFAGCNSWDGVRAVLQVGMAGKGVGQLMRSAPHAGAHIYRLPVGRGRHAG
jgi:hypothetical protein